MKLKTLKKTARGWKHDLQDQIQGDEGGGHMALLAWEILGGLVVLFAIFVTFNMIPEMVRYLKIKRM